MNVYLLDVNVLVALSWPTHESHQRVERWFANHARQGWATCPITQAGFVRILSNRSFSQDALTVADAIRLLASNLQHSEHLFWPNELSLYQAVSPFGKRLVGHQQITDAYLLGLAQHRKGKLATLDTSVATLLPEGNLGLIELI